MTRVLIADQHDVVRVGLRSILETHGGCEIVAEACDGREAVSKAMATKPDVAIIDCSLPLMNGIETTKQIRTRAPDTEVLALTARGSETLVGEFVHAGARGYLRKSNARQELIAAVESLAQHKTFITGDLGTELVKWFLSTHKPKTDSALTARERTVVQLIADGLNNKQIGAVLCLSVKTIESHRASAMRKVNVTSAAGLVRYAIRNKLVEP
jgi:DNA-binding NarL/FixJ family response regulator